MIRPKTAAWIVGLSALTFIALRRYEDKAGGGSIVSRLKAA